MFTAPVVVYNGAMRETFVGIVEKFVALVAARPPDDALARLAQMRDLEDDPAQRALYDAYFENFAEARRTGRPCCQDTGLPCFYLRAGTAFPFLDLIADALAEAVRRATESVPLRPNAVDFFDESNSGGNVAERVPWIEWDLVPGSRGLEITLFLSGAGCSLPGKARVFKPSDGYEAIVPFVFEAVVGPGLNACPPLVVGIGLGHGMENAAALSKKACLRPIGSSHARPEGARLEKNVLDGLNALGIGAQGLPGRRVAMAVHLETSGRHAATIGCAVSLSCYVHRRGILRLGPDLSFEIPTHGGASP